MNFEQLPLMKRIDWTTTLFLILTPVAAILLTPLHLYLDGLDWRFVAVFLLFFSVTNLSITAGYHRLLAHRSYECTGWLKWLYLIVGAGAFQGPALKWASDHRRHHSKVDTEEDPYNIGKGFLHAHIGWLFLKEHPKYKGAFSPDLKKDAAISWQYRHYIPLAITVGFGVPIFIGWLLGSALGGLLILGLFRIILSQHFTFFINSLCHTIGKRPYNDRNSARDSLVMAFFTSGEGYHNYHHQFQTDYRNGVRWYQWDPTKWWIKTLSYVGFTYGLRSIPETEILKAKIRLDERRLLARGVPQEKVSVLKQKIETALQSFRNLGEEYQKLRSSMASSSKEKLTALKADLRVAKLECKFALAQWTTYLRTFRALPY